MTRTPSYFTQAMLDLGGRKELSLKIYTLFPRILNYSQILVFWILTSTISNIKQKRLSGNIIEESGGGRSAAMAPP